MISTVVVVNEETSIFFGRSKISFLYVCLVVLITLSELEQQSDIIEALKPINAFRPNVFNVLSSKNSLLLELKILGKCFLNLLTI